MPHNETCTDYMYWQESDIITMAATKDQKQVK